jgi:SNF2 family DNA or RNA helicase
MVPKEVKENFINREVDDYSWLKELSKTELEEYYEEAAEGFQPKTPLYEHQKTCFVIGASKPNFYFMLDMGLGKSLVTLSLLEYHKRAGRLDKTLIIVPKAQHLYTWEEEVAKHSNLSICVLDDTTRGREALLDTSDADLFVLNYPGLIYLVSDYKKVVDRRTGKEKGQQVINSEKIEWLSSKFQALVLDESQKIKNRSTLSFQACKRISLRTPFRYLLSGTPFGRDPQDLWSQFNIVDNGQTLGQTLGIFRECFFTTKKNYWGGYDHKFIKKMEPQLNRLLKNRSIWYSAEECQSLPEQVFNNVHVKFNEEMENYYERLVNEIKANNKDFKVINSTFIKMRMLTSGFLGFVNESSQEKVNITFKDNPKLDAMMEIIEGFRLLRNSSYSTNSFTAVTSFLML